MMGWLTDWLPRIVARAPATIRTKLLAAFLSIVVLLITVGAVGLEVLTRVERHAEEMVTLQRKIAAYRQLQHDTTAQLYSVTSALLIQEEASLAAALRQLNQFGYDFDRLQFVAKDEVGLLAELRSEYDQFIGVVAKVVELIQEGKVAEGRALQAAQAGPLADRMERLTNQLVNRAEADMVASIEANQGAHLTSLFMIAGFGAGSILLALVLGYAISLSLIRPVEQMEARFNELASGDFSRQIDVPNRDELGSLAANLNRMIDELGRLYRQLEAANLAKSRFLAAASHDLRQPLHALNLFVAQLRTETDPTERARIAAQIDASVTAMNDLFNALLDISKLDAGALAPNLTRFPIVDLLKQIEATFARAAGDKGLRLRFARSDAWVESDFILLQRILLNLVSNAVRYTDRGGVVVGCRRRGARLRIEIWDSGIGIPKDQWENVFGEFYRLSGPGQERRGGLGLGLAIVERLCRLLDHRVELRSAPGKGSCLAIEAPLVAPQPAAEHVPAPEATTDPASGKLIVVIDDDALVLDSMRGVLRSWGCFVVAAESGPAALATLNGDERRPDLIISDYRLSDGHGGIATVEKLRQAFGAPIPAFLITGDTAPERLREAGASGLRLLHKPVAPMALRAMLNQLLREGRSAARSPGASAAASPAHQPQ
ncbi:MAG TPA: ATP-binding protein [Burkholderiales bacterium]|jgi:signal transduction histidine kinase/CheY-like chemotaxis protein|nr:ATP-binding protein [Burkholderiales bacterium]